MEFHDKIKPINICLDSVNYRYWPYVTTNFLQGKNLFKYTDGYLIMPILNMRQDNYAKALSDHEQSLSEWRITNARIITWISTTIAQDISLQLSKFTTKVAWDFLANLYKHDNYDKMSCLPK